MRPKDVNLRQVPQESLLRSLRRSLGVRELSSRQLTLRRRVPPQDPEIPEVGQVQQQGQLYLRPVGPQAPVLQGDLDPVLLLAVGNIHAGEEPGYLGPVGVSG